MRKVGTPHTRSLPACVCRKPNLDLLLRRRLSEPLDYKRIQTIMVDVCIKLEVHSVKAIPSRLRTEDVCPYTVAALQEILSAIRELLHGGGHEKCYVLCT